MPRGDGHVRKHEYDRDGRKWTRYEVTVELADRNAGERRQRVTRTFQPAQEEQEPIVRDLQAFGTIYTRLK